MLLSGALSPWRLCRATSDRLLRPNVPLYLPGAPSNVAGPVVLRRVSFLEAAVPMLPRRAFRPGHRAILALWWVASQVSLHRGQQYHVTSKVLSGLHCLRHSGLSGSPDERVSGTFALVKQTPTVLVFLSSC